MRRRTKRYWLIAILLVLMYFFNPSFDKHIDRLKAKYEELYDANKGNDIVFGSQFQYNNYYFFSTTTNKVSDEHERASIGILGIIF